jgi:hypothetical protein
MAAQHDRVALVPFRTGIGDEVSDFADPAAILGVLFVIYAVLRWVDYAGTRVAARHPAQPRQRRH